MVKLTKFHKKNIERMLNSANVPVDLVDIEAIWNKDNSAKENYDLVRKNIQLLEDMDKKMEKNYQKDEVEYYEDLTIQQEREYIQKEIEKGLEEIKKSTTPQLDKYFWKLKKFTEILLKGNIHSFFVIGKCGLGKTFNTIRVLADRGVEFQYVVGNISPLEMYHILYRNREKIILFDDTQALLNNKASMSILMSALWSATGKRIVEWRTTSKKLKAPPIFEFKGKIIFTLNELPDSEDVRTLISRCFSYEMAFDYPTILKIMYEIAKLKHKKLSKEERFAICDFIKDNSSEATKDFNLRLQKKIETIYIYEKDRWKELALEILKPDVELLIIKQLMEKTKVVKKQVKKWIEITGKSRRTFFRYRKKLLVSPRELGVKKEV